MSDSSLELLSRPYNVQAKSRLPPQKSFNEAFVKIVKVELANPYLLLTQVLVCRMVSNNGKVITLIGN